MGGSSLVSLSIYVVMHTLIVVLHTSYFFYFSSGQPWRAVPGVAVAHSDIIICVFVTISVDFHTFFNKIWKLGRELGNGGVYASTADQTH